MFTPLLANLPRGGRIRPEDIPPPTPVKLPSSNPPLAAIAPPPQLPLARLIQQIRRPTDLTAGHLSALGLQVVSDARPVDIIPDSAYCPDFAAWERLSPEEAAEKNDSTRRPLCITNRSPGCKTYLDRKRELSYPNSVAFRSVRRLPHAKGQPAPKLGSSYDFWRCLETLTMYWDDPTEPPKPVVATAAGEASPGTAPGDKETDSEECRYYRIRNAETIPHDTLRSAMASFIRIVVYEFGCTVQASRLEPRLHLNSPPIPGSASQRSSISSGCSFIVRSPTDRLSARQMIVGGPLATVSVRLSIGFATDMDDIVDLGREVLAALITAQHRARENRTEKRLGEDQWWASKPRWGGGPGGPIGREVDKYDVGDKDANQAVDADGNPIERGRNAGAAAGDGASADAAKPARSGIKSRKPNAFDIYRQVRPPAPSWDAKTRYEAIGRLRGADYDDVFVVSGLFHHICILRFRVPDRLLGVLEGATEGTAVSWGGLKVWRSPWLDLFVENDRILALQILWAVMTYQMRERPEQAPEQQQGES